ncbi:hypothetical protein ACIQCF_38480 [Streptomyces sp. NPDC088353]|uniref:hypothetical protein n=1 Tax=Streptomyces sp. NPDC088353 TaxID=3365855 RepID=UPI00382FF33E
MVPGVVTLLAYADPQGPTEGTGQPAADRPLTHVVSEPRTDASAPENDRDPTAEEPRGCRVPYDEPGALAMLLDKRTEDDDVSFRLLQFLSMKATARDPARLRELARSFIEQSAARGE